MEHPHSARQFLGKALPLLVGLALLGYGIFEGRRLIEGPQITVTSPHDGQVVSGPVIHIEGTAHNAAFFSINDKQTFVDTAGYFAEISSPPPGYTVVVIRAEDRFGRVTKQTLRITVADYCILPA